MSSNCPETTFEEEILITFLHIHFTFVKIVLSFGHSKFKNQKQSMGLQIEFNCRSCSWQLPKTESEVPRMSSDVGVSRIWNRMLDAAFDNSNRYVHTNNLLEYFGNNAMYM